MADFPSWSTLIIYLPLSDRGAAKELFMMQGAQERAAYGTYLCPSDQVDEQLQEFYVRWGRRTVLVAMECLDAEIIRHVLLPYQHRKMPVDQWAPLIARLSCARFYRDGLCVVCEYDVLSEGGAHAQDCPVSVMDMSYFNGENR